MGTFSIETFIAESPAMMYAERFREAFRKPNEIWRSILLLYGIGAVQS